MEKYDWIIIGAGPGGYVAAIRAAQLDQRVLLIEKEELGGTCLNSGCIPTKTLLHSSQNYRALFNLEEIGIKIEKSTFDIDQMYERKTKIVKNLRKGIENLIRRNNINYIKGEAKIVAEKQVDVDGKSYFGARVLVATGTKPVIPYFEGHDNPKIITSDEILARPFQEEELVIIGGGVIGVEIASFYSDLGKKVTIIEREKTILPQMDIDISKNIVPILRRKGVKIYTGANLNRVYKEEGNTYCEFTSKEQKKYIVADEILLSVGRKAEISTIFEEELLPEMAGNYISIDDYGRTSRPWLYAVGDVTGGLQLAHRASHQGIRCVENAVKGKSFLDTNTVPSCVYTKPEIASVGLTQQEAEEKGIDVYIGKYAMNGNGRTIIEMSSRGFIKLIFEKESDILVGAHLMCERATDLINELSLGIANKLTRKNLSSMMRAHPTFGEGISEAIEDSVGMSIHSLPKKV